MSLSISNDLGYAVITPDPMIDVGNGYTDGSMQMLVRTSDNRLWIPSWKFDYYPAGNLTGGLGMTLRMYKADQTGVPSTFTRMDSTNEPSNATQWACALDGNNVIHVLWMERTAWTPPGTLSNLKYCQFNTGTGTWGSVTTIDNAIGITNESGQGDEHCSIAIDASNVAHVVYLKHDGTRRRVNYRNNSGGSWSDATIVDNQSMDADEWCQHPGITFDNSGNIVVTWVVGASEGDSQGHAYIRRYTGSWGTSYDITGGTVWPGIDACLRLYLDPDGRYHICTLNSSKYIQYWYSDNNGQTWSSNHPGSGTTLGDDPVPAPGPDGTVRVYAHDSRTPVGVSYWQGAGGSASWGDQIEYTADGEGPFDCTVNVRWSQYHHRYPTILDIAYWASNYPTNELYVGVDQ